MAARATQQFLKGEVIIQEGQPGDRVFRILSGEVLVCKRNNSTALVPVARLHAGEIFGEMYLFDSQQIRTATVVASCEVQVEILPHEEMRGMLDRLSPSLSNILKGFSYRLSKVSANWADTVIPKEPTKNNHRLPNGAIRPTGTDIGR